MTKVYQVNFWTPDDGSTGCTWCSSKKQALKILKEAKEKYKEDFEEEDAQDMIYLSSYNAPKTIPELIRFLNDYCSYPDNG